MREEQVSSTYKWSLKKELIYAHLCIILDFTGPKRFSGLARIFLKKLDLLKTLKVSKTYICFKYKSCLGGCLKYHNMMTESVWEW